MQAQALAYTAMGKWQMSPWFNALPTPSKRHLDRYLAGWKAFNLDILKSAQEVRTMQADARYQCEADMV